MFAHPLYHEGIWTGQVRI